MDTNDESEVRTSEVVMKISNNLAALQDKLDRENRKTQPDSSLIKKLAYQLKCCRRGLKRKIYGQELRSYISAAIHSDSLSGSAVSVAG